MSAIFTLRRLALLFAGLVLFAIAFPVWWPAAAQTQPLAADPMPPPQQGPSLGGPQIGRSIKNDVSPPLRDLRPMRPLAPPEPREIPLLLLPGRRTFTPSGMASPAGSQDPVLQSLQDGPSMPAPSQNFEGVNNRNNVLPPDVNGDVGPNHYVQMINLSFAVYNKSGTLLYGPANANTLWAGFGAPCETTNDGDPIAVYDPLADRWLLSQFSQPNDPNGPYYECIAISQTPDPTGAYYRYAFLISNTKLNDYPKFGVWPDGYYMSVNQFRVKKAHSLVNKRSNITLAAGANTIDLGMLLEGNANDDTTINSLDYAPLATAYLKLSGQPGFDGRVDFNEDGYINAIDYAPLAANYLKSSDVELSAFSSSPREPVVSVAGGPVTVSVAFADALVRAGEIVPFEMWVDAGSELVAAVDVFLDFDPAYFEMVDSAGNPVTLNAFIPGVALPRTNFNQGDSATGQAVYSAGMPPGGTSATGIFLLASGFLETKAAPIGATSVSVHYNTGDPSDARNTIISDSFGNPLTGVFQSGTVRFLGNPIFLPVVMGNYTPGDF